jgi:hypothetical protein
MQDELNTMTSLYGSRAILVVAGNQSQFDDFCKEALRDFDCGDTKYNGADFHYYENENTLLGRVFDDVVFYGDYREDLDYDIVLAHLRNDPRKDILDNLGVFD